MMPPPQQQPPSAEPPPFQESPRCDVCKCSFNAFRRRHHCRCCGRTLCHEHSSNQMALPQFGIYSSVRACSDCFNKFSQLGKDEPPNYVDAFDATADTIARLKMDLDVGVKIVSNARNAASDVPECKCGMPLCICEAPKPDPAPLQLQKSTTSTVQSNPRPKKVMSTQETAESTSKNIASSSNNNKTSLFFNLGQANNGSLDKVNTDYEVNGEGVREAIKNNDATAVKRLLSEGVDPNYCDKQGLTLLHLAAVFNQTEIAFILMDHGASLECKNAQGETPLDCAPTMLQYKMCKRMEGGA